MANYKQEPWKLPLTEFIEGLYLKRFARAPDKVCSNEQLVKERAKNKVARKMRKEEMPSLSHWKPYPNVPF